MTVLGDEMFVDTAIIVNIRFQIKQIMIKFTHLLSCTDCCELYIVKNNQN